MYKYNYTVKFHDVDAAGIIFHANVFRIAHDAYQEMMNEYNFSAEYFTSEKYGYPLVHTEADYFLPLKFNQKIIVEIAIKEIRENSFEINYKFCDETNTKFVEVKTVHVCIDKSNFKKTKLPEEVVKILSGL